MPAEDGDNSGAILKIGTHNGTFHCDEVLACFMLRLLDEYRDAAIVRTRDEAKLAECDVVVDVGAVYDAETKRFDHHQRSFGETMNSIDPANRWTTKLSSAGLVYCHYGKAVLKSLMGKAGEDESVVSLIYGKVYENFVQEIDAIDNGIDQYDGEMRYRITTNLSSRVAHLNPSWNEEKPDEQAAFNKAMAMVGKEFVDRVSHYISVWLPARDIVEKSFLARHKVDAGGQVMELCRFCPWKEHLFAIEKEHGVEGKDEIKYVIYQDQAGNWRLQCVPKGSNTFENRLSIKAEWRGVRNEELSKLSGISGCIFVHANGFIAGTKTRDGVLEMARKSLESSS